MCGFNCHYGHGDENVYVFWSCQCVKLCYLKMFQWYWKKNKAEKMTTNNELKEKLAWTFASQEVEFANVFALQCSYLSLKMDGVTQMSKDMLSFIWNGSDSGTWILFL